MSFHVGLTWPLASTLEESFRSECTHALVYVFIFLDTCSKSWAEMMFISKSWKGFKIAILGGAANVHTFYGGGRRRKGRPLANEGKTGINRGEMIPSRIGKERIASLDHMKPGNV